MIRKPLQVFISHTTSDPRDHALARSIADAIRKEGGGVWIAPDNIPAGDDWKKNLVRGILEECTHFLVILSAASIQSRWVIEEIDLARQRRSSDASFSILPLQAGRVQDYPGKEFIDAIRGDGQIEFTDFATGLRYMEFTSAVSLSAERGEAVTIRQP